MLMGARSTIVAPGYQTCDVYCGPYKHYMGPLGRAGLEGPFLMVRLRHLLYAWFEFHSWSIFRVYFIFIVIIGRLFLFIGLLNVICLWIFFYFFNLSLNYAEYIWTGLLSSPSSSLFLYESANMRILINNYLFHISWPPPTGHWCLLFLKLPSPLLSPSAAPSPTTVATNCWADTQD